MNKKLEIYEQVKKNNIMENYLIRIPSTEKRRAITKLRISAHNFPIEKGRYDNTPKHRRKCTACHSSCIGDEFHILMECCNPELNKLRESCKLRLERAVPQLKYFGIREKFIYIISCADIECSEIVGSYFLKCLRIMGRHS